MLISRWALEPARLLHRTASGVAHVHVRWPDGQPPTPFGCRWCGDAQRGHGLQHLTGRGFHGWEQPTQAQVKARMRARRTARKAVCRCAGDDNPRPFAPVVDPYSCESVDCAGHFSELSPFGGARPVNAASAEVSRTCACGWRTSVWHVDDGSAEAELHGHVARVHGDALRLAGEGS